MIRSMKKPLLLALLAFTATPRVAASQGLEFRVNLPAYRLDVYRDRERIRTYPVAIGSPRYQTPQGAYDIRYVEWNPWWNPPASEWAKDEKRTPPGPSNPMGRAKIEFLPLFYIHGSSAPVGKAVSHGCIRMRNADVLELARLIASESGAAIGASQISGLERSSKRTTRVALPNPVRLEIVYQLAEEVDGSVQVYDDVYDVGMSSAERALARGAERPGG
jgi:murein L,D-transpeptidase YcbB/YkuD